MISVEDYSRLMQLIGNIEGCAIGIDTVVSDYLVDSAAGLSEILEKHSPVEAEKGRSQDVPAPCSVCDKQGWCGTCSNNPLLAVKTASVVEI